MHSNFVTNGQMVEQRVRVRVDCCASINVLYFPYRVDELAVAECVKLQIGQILDVNEFFGIAEVHFVGPVDSVDLVDAFQVERMRREVGGLQRFVCVLRAVTARRTSHTVEGRDETVASLGCLGRNTQRGAEVRRALFSGLDLG